MGDSRKSFSVADELTGHASSKSAETKAEEGIGPGAAKVPFQLEGERKTNSLSHFFATLKQIFTDKGTRNEFKNFILTKFKGS